MGDWSLTTDATFTNDYEGFQAYCSSWPANGGAFNGGTGTCANPITRTEITVGEYPGCEPVQPGVRYSWLGSHVEMNLPSLTYGELASMGHCFSMCGL